MIRFHQKITIINLRKPTANNINQELQWLGNSLGLFNLRDKDKSCFRIFIELLKTAKKKQALSSDELAYKLNLSRGTVIHHINKLIDAGIVVEYKNRYLLRVDNLSSLIEEVEKDIKRTCENLKAIAKEIDTRLGLG
ncbi:winged helix-turn-helix transcriptional regulator [Candidatus Woesearchaeota archaeon]|nr:winged helix-turn-helix transcriptional regulator [Candidatus Woesearchaeota archaeon]